VAATHGNSFIGRQLKSVRRQRAMLNSAIPSNDVILCVSLKMRASMALAGALADQVALELGGCMVRKMNPGFPIVHENLQEFP
jgi:hypothetical protein